MLGTLVPLRQDAPTLFERTDRPGPASDRGLRDRRRRHPLAALAAGLLTGSAHRGGRGGRRRLGTGRSPVPVAAHRRGPLPGRGRAPATLTGLQVAVAWQA
ncbi:hypothetical protein G5V59_01680 [Nocardioides sp. W3-2-3]|uniref:hypothetical protein n=1 Tax=Nocardioides convexus TaxID=2712224 RepID=UPI0024189809|nr:hypothetical protein [Nocardioides convexus]NGZ99542.1 hypothetical protein [Nocardioides convexus]